MLQREFNTLQYFRPHEFACHCGECGSTGLEMEYLFLVKLDQLRKHLGRPMQITSGYRCSAYNEKISTTGPNGPHTTGRAADVLIKGPEAFHMMQQCTLGGWMTGIGLNQKGPMAKRFIHLDDLVAPGHPRPRVWTY